MSIRSRQDELIRTLRRSGMTTVASITGSLGISRRTALRDISALRDQGYVIHTSSGPGGGVYLDPQSVLVTPKLASSEVFALLISVAVLKVTHSIPFANLADSGLKKIEQSLPRDRVLELREILKSVYLGNPASNEMLSTVQEIDATVLPVFETCFLHSKRMQFNYSDAKGNKTTRFTDPHAMLVLSPIWYMVAYDPSREAFRHFRMDRITNATVLEETFRHRKLDLGEEEYPFETLSAW